MKVKLSMICTKQENGAYVAVCPEIKGCFTQGDSFEDACSNLKELVEITINDDLSDEEKEYILLSKDKIFTEFEIEMSYKDIR
ncbi:MAG: type II toxin-antitoxin system HicB family antitoxin [Candidatus Cloacimonetes bacterium]|nr:type II toxin-antitoxin system HicB family antitoxin [Candidatus Cloacimonadota bacterium]